MIGLLTNQSYMQRIHWPSAVIVDFPKGRKIDGGRVERVRIDQCPVEAVSRSETF